MKSWPLLNRNKVQDSKVHIPVEACATLEDETVKTLAQAVSTTKTVIQSMLSQVYSYWIIGQHFLRIAGYQKEPLRYAYAPQF